MVSAVGWIGPRPAWEGLFRVGTDSKELFDDRFEWRPFAAQISPGVGDLFGGQQHGPDVLTRRRIGRGRRNRGWCILLGIEIGCDLFDVFAVGFSPSGFVVRNFFGGRRCGKILLVRVRVGRSVTLCLILCLTLCNTLFGIFADSSPDFCR